ncbi:hypothetical protein ACLX1H_000202 [Fusarium chlamydosporum]
MKLSLALLSLAAMGFALPIEHPIKNNLTNMDSSHCSLSSPAYGYDFVISTTQATINLGLKKYLYESKLPASYFYFLTTGINPFEVPEDTPYSDARIQKLTAARFKAVIKIEVIPMAKNLLDTQIANPEASINQWAGVSDWSTPLEQTTGQTVSGKKDPTKGQTSGSQMLLNHYKSNASSLTVVGSPPANDSVQQLFDDLLTAVEQEGQSLYEAYNRLKGLATNFTSMYIDDVLKQLVDILANVFLSGMKTVGDATLNILCDLASTAFDALDTNIHIPVISDILNALGVPDLSMLDLFCWIPTVAYTVTYKIAHDSAPVSSTEADAIIGAESWDDLKALFGGSAAVPSQQSSSAPEGANLEQ